MIWPIEDKHVDKLTITVDEKGDLKLIVIPSYSDEAIVVTPIWDYIVLNAEIIKASGKEIVIAKGRGSLSCDSKGTINSIFYWIRKVLKI